MRIPSAGKNSKEEGRKGDRERDKEERKEGGGKRRETESEREKEKWLDIKRGPIPIIDEE